MKEVDEQVSFKAFKLFFFANGVFSLLILISLQMLAVQNKNSANFVEWIPNNVKVFLFFGSNLGFVVLKSDKSPRSRFVTCHLVVFRWLLRLLATPPPYRCFYGKERTNKVNLKAMSKKNWVTAFFRKSLSEFLSSSRLCSAGRLSSTGTQVNSFENTKWESQCKDQR